MKKFRIPNFRGNHAYLILREDHNHAVLAQRLKQLGMVVESSWPGIGDEVVEANFVFFDADIGFDGQFPWLAKQVPMPLIAVIGSEAPGRLEWAIENSPSAYLLKPIQPAGIFNALVMGFQNFKKLHDLEADNQKLRIRLKARESVVKALLTLMHYFEIEENEAFELLRSVSMVRRLTIENMSDRILTGNEKFMNELGLAGNVFKKKIFTKRGG